MQNGIPSMQDLQKQAEREQQELQMSEQKQMILDQIMEPQARERLDRLKLAKKEKAAAVEDSLINAAKSGALKQKVTEDQLIKMLEGITDQDEGEGGKRKIAIQRKKYADDSSDDNDDDLL